VLEEISKIKRISENKIEYASSQFNFKMKDLQDQLNESIKRERTSREKAIELLQTHDRVREIFNSLGIFLLKYVVLE
jgi:hypothetical protein